MINTLSIFIGNTLSIVIVTILMLNLPYGFTKGRLQGRVFAVFSLLITLGALFGIGSAIFDGYPGAVGRLMVTLCGSGGIIMPVLVSFNFLLYVETTGKENIRQVKSRFIIALIPVVFIIALVIINLFNPIVFTVSAENIYARGSLGLIAYVVGPMYLIVALIRIAFIKAQHRGFLFVPIMGVFVPIAIVSVIQISVYGVLQSWLGFSIAVMTFYIGMNKDFLYRDSMTKVFNRIYLDYIVENAIANNAPLGGIVLDIDHFKSINDTLGHSMGDEVIRKAANILRLSTDDNTNVIRLGGDEFMVVGYTNDERYLELIMERIRENCKIEGQKKTIPVEVEFSMGSAIFFPDIDTKFGWLSRMDKKMYAEKTRRRMESGVDRRARNGSSL